MPDVHKMNKCTLCSGRAGADAASRHRGFRASDACTFHRRTCPNQVFVSDLPLPSGGTLPNATVPELAHEPACVSICPAKAMKWDTKANILAYLNDPANGYMLANGTQNWIGNGSMFWASKKILLTPPKADPFIEDHIAPDGEQPALQRTMVVPTLVLGGLARSWCPKAKVAAEEADAIMEEV